MSIRKFLDLSTGHLPKEDRLLIDLHRPNLPFRVVNNEYGWSMWLMEPDVMDDVIEELENKFKLTDALGHVLRYAIKYDCAMVNFDRDAERIDGLGYFETNLLLKCPNCLENGFGFITRQCVLCDFDEANDPNTW